MKLIVGLGNPGKEYDGTRHNVGFLALDFISSKYGLEFNKKKFNGIYAEKNIEGEKVIFLKPQQYINLSGDVIKKFMDYYKLNIDDVFIIHDDMDTPVGKYKLKSKGGSAGHNGLKNIENNLKTNEYKRLKIGISKNKQIDMVNYVLGKFSIEDKKKLDEVMKIIPLIIENYFNMSFDNLMNKYNLKI